MLLRSGKQLIGEVLRLREVCLILLSELISKLVDLKFVGGLHPVEFSLVLQCEGFELAGVTLVKVVLRLFHGCEVLLLDVLQGLKRLDEVVVNPLKVPFVLGVSIQKFLDFSIQSSVVPFFLIFGECVVLVLKLLVIPGGLVTISLSQVRISCLHLLKVGPVLLLSCFHGLGVRQVSRLGFLREIRFHLDDVSAMSLDHSLILVSQLLFGSLLQVEKVSVLFLSSGFGLAEQRLKLSFLLGHRLKMRIALLLLVASQIF